MDPTGPLASYAVAPKFQQPQQHAIAMPAGASQLTNPGSIPFAGVQQPTNTSTNSKRTALGDRYQLGEELGRGAYGQVYKGTDLLTSEPVAIKQISLGGLAQENLQGVMGEIELLKTLNHPNIVKYIGSFKTRTHLYIILEYMENGPLSAIIKPNRLGLFSEPLVVVYIAQVLRGLQYLHEQGVVHRDIKGANILTTKEGLVKLADFGVAAKLGELEDRRDELHQHVVGTPYWMAPEVIEMTQVTSASDIWSVGCLIMELLTGSPPYYDVQPMSALFRIVQDECPTLPDNITPLMEDFLRRCFHKDPRKRPGARELLQHEWMRSNQRTLRNSWKRHSGHSGAAASAAAVLGVALPLPGAAGPGQPAAASADHESVTSVISRMVALAEEPAAPTPTAAAAAGAAATDLMVASHQAGGAPYRLLQDAGAASTSPRLSTPPSEPPGVVSPAQVALTGPLAAASTAAAAGAAAAVGVLGAAGSSALHAAAAAASAGGVEEIEGLPCGALTNSAAAAVAAVAQGYAEVDEWAQQPAVAAAAAAPVPGPITSLVAMLGGTAQPIGGQLTPWLLEADCMAPAAGASRATSQLAPGGWGPVVAPGPPAGPSAHEGGGTAASGFGLDFLGPAANSALLDLRRQVRELVRALRPSPLVVAGGGGGGAALAARAVDTVTGLTPAGACHVLAALVAALPDAKQLMMTETGALVLLELLDTDHPRTVEGAMELLLAITAHDVVTLETICLLGVVPAAAKYALLPYPASLRLRTASFLARFFNSGPSTLAHFVACQGLKQLVAMVADLPVPKPSPSVPTMTAYGQPQVPLPLPPPGESPGLGLSQVAINCIFQFLDCYNILPHNYLCRLLAQNGLVPRLFIVLKETIVQLARPQITSRANATGSGGGPLGAGAALLQSGGAGAGHMPPASANWRMGAGAQTVDTRQRGMAPLPTLAQRLNAGASLTVDARTLKLASAAAMEEPAPLPVPVLTHEELGALQEAAVSLLLLLSNADVTVKGYCCMRDNLQQHLDCLERLAPPSLTRLMRALRWLSCEHAMLPAIKDAGAISVLVPMLSKDRVDLGGLPAAQVQLEALHTLYNICKFNKVHLEAAATVGITPHLNRMAADAVAMLAQRRQQAAQQPGTSNGNGTSPGQVLGGGGEEEDGEAALLEPAGRWRRLRGFVVPLMIALVGASSSTRAKLWAAGGPDLLLALLADPESVELGVPGALELWLAEDHARMEPKLTQREPVAQLVALYARIAQAQDSSVLPALLSVLRGMIGRSSKLAVALALGPSGIVPCLLAMVDKAAPILRVKILEILRCLYEHYPRPKEFLLQHRIAEVLRRLLESGGRGADAVHQEAQRLLTAFQINVLF